MNGTVQRYAKSQFKMAWVKDLCDCCSSCEISCSMKHFHEAHRSKCGIRMDLNYNMGIYNAAYCRQCDAPGCVLACRKGACYIDAETGIRRIDKETCVGCKLCMKACPFDAVVYDAAAKKCFKCDLCDGDPTCAKQCPSRAIKVISTSKKRGERQ